MKLLFGRPVIERDFPPAELPVLGPLTVEMKFRPTVHYFILVNEVRVWALTHNILEAPKS